MENLEKKSKLKRSDNPYQYLLLGILRQALSDISCYYERKGTPTERKYGKSGIIWIKNKQGSFRLIAIAYELLPFEIPSDKFYTWCVEKLEEMRLNSDLITPPTPTLPVSHSVKHRAVF